MEQDPLELTEEPPVKKEKIEEDEQITIKEELEDEDCTLEPKKEIMDDILAADLTDFLDTTGSCY